MAIGDAELAVAAAQAGALIVRERYGTALARHDKGGGDFATAADIEAERAILDMLRSARPDDAVTGEESGDSGPAGAERRWLVDPLCGTLNYAAGTMLVAVNVALRTAGATIAAVADPFTDEVFWTDGRRAAVRRAGGDEPLAPSGESRLVDVNLDPPFPNGARFRAVRLLADAGFAERFRPRVLSTSLPLTWVAAGRRAGYVTDGGLASGVHGAAGVALCQAAGCVVTGLDGAPLGSGIGGLVAAADAGTHAALIDLIAGQPVDA
ncbi:phosphatase [Actinocatenispora thailandica]|uniref:Phosphatase n=1 Tax=Actinocatenispora thailandica TaxID=227318 RepID=A0A7R7DU44_9ACTN|nr:inositol monophosphatase family protein [Actinocatenispora thailandica]BCJ37487.1 phosphatase [Actinocatenispora thailandica]